jgi:hypothetical protein
VVPVGTVAAAAVVAPAGRSSVTAAAPGPVALVAPAGLATEGSVAPVVVAATAGSAVTPGTWAAAAGLVVAPVVVALAAPETAIQGAPAARPVTVERAATLGC